MALLLGIGRLSAGEVEARARVSLTWKAAPAVLLGTSKFPEEQVTAWGLGSDWGTVLSFQHVLPFGSDQRVEKSCAS